MIKVSVHNLSTEGIPVKGSHNPGFLEFKDDMASIQNDISYDLNASLIISGALVEGTASVTLSSTCTRCLEPCEKTFENSQVCHYYDNPLPSELDLTDNLREDILIIIPQNIICSDECHGLCPECGIDLNKNSCDCSGGGSKGGVWSELDKLNC